MLRSVGILFLALAAAATAKTSAVPMAMEHDLVPILRAQLLSDLDQLQLHYVLASPSFDARARERAVRLISRLTFDGGALQPLPFLLSVAKVAALADNGHDMAFAMGTGWRAKTRLPLRVIWFADGLTIARSADEYHDLTGAKILTIDGKDASRIMERLRPYQGGTDEYRRWALTWALTSPEVLHAMGIAKYPDEVVLRLRLRDGRTVERTIAAVLVSELPKPAREQALWYPSPLPGETELHWAVATSAAPLYLQEPEEWFRSSDLPVLDALYVQFRSNMDEGGSRIEPFVARVTERLRTAPPHNLILDLRFDTGGDNTKNRDLMGEIARRVPGKIYVITSNYTFSAGIASAAALKHDGGKRVVIVGSAVGDRLHWWSEHRDMLCLQNSQVCVSPNHGLWDIERGCKGNPHCYGDQFNLNVGSLTPSLHAPVTSADWLEGRDPAMEAIAQNLRASSD